VKLVVGGRAAYAYSGGKAFDATAPCVVFVHGALHDHSVWTLLARWCANHGYGVLAPDLPAHGRSDGPALTSAESLADWLLELLDAAGVRQAAFVGHSMGSLVALEAAAKAPARVTALVLAGTAYPMSVSAALLDSARTTPLAAIDAVNVFSHSSFAAKPSYPGPGSSLHGGNRALMRRVQAGCSEANLFLVDFQVCDRYRGGLDAAARVRCPVTLVLGEHDQMTRPSQAAELAAALQAKTVRVPCGHSMMAEAPDALLGALRQALPAR
jgi:pimeloyl-ACP methyl ester carboxylesterase